MLVGEVALVRSGDKGAMLNLSLIPLDPGDFGWLDAALPADRVAELYAPLGGDGVERYALPGVPAFNYVLRGALGGGVSRTLALDAHGKAWGALLLCADIGDRPGTA